LADGIPIFLTCLMLVAADRDATAMELDSLLPTDIPGYGVARGVSVLDRSHPEYAPVDIDLGGTSVDPKIVADAGYDSEPNGAAPGSASFDFNPSLTALDAALGLGAYLAGTATAYPEAAGQNLSGYTAALGERALLPRETLSLGVAAVAAKETSFGLNSIAISKPINARVRQVRGNDAIICGMVTLTPALSVTEYGFSGEDRQNRTDYRQALTSEFTPGGPARFVTLLHATESAYQNPLFNATTLSALAGVADDATGIWNLRLLAGAATRRPATGGSLTAPVLEASISWMPTDLDSLKLDAAREIDDPDQESAAGYTLTQTNISIAHEYLRNVILTASFAFSHAAYFGTPQVESLYAADAAVNWHLNRALAVNASYAFNDRQSNFLKAANQHIFTLGVTWSP
jgi:hypothetical protein